MSWRGKLLASGQDAKTVKGEKEGYATAIMYMLPWKSAGINVCPMAEQAGCIDGCLNSAGMGKFSNVQAARAKKTAWFAKDRKGFLEALERDITNFIKWANKQGKTPAIRLNGTSDIRWENHGIIQKFPDVQFYDYTKISNRKNLPDNYHLTWSYSEVNEAYVAKAPKKENWAVVFRTKNLPKTFKGREVIDGDKDDLRFLNGKGKVIGLYAKGKAKKDTSGFVVDV